MKILKEIVATTFLILGIPAVFAQNHTYSSSSEIVIGTISGEISKGEAYELYESSADSFLGYLAGWKHAGRRDSRVMFSDRDIYNECLAEAKRRYGSSYQNLTVKDIQVRFEEQHLPDEEYYSQVAGSSTKYREKERVKSVYMYTATVVTTQ